MTAPSSAASRLGGALLLAAVALLAAACAALPGRDDPRVTVVGVEPLPGQGLELRFAVKLRVQNPNDTPIEYDGVAIDLDLNGKGLATGVSPERGTVPRFGEAVFAVPVTVSALAAVRQALALADGRLPEKIPFVLRGKLAGGVFGTLRFTDQGTLALPRGFAAAN